MRRIFARFLPPPAASAPSAHIARAYHLRPRNNIVRPRHSSNAPDHFTKVNFLFNIFRLNFRKFRPQTLYKFSEVKYNDTVNTPNRGVCSQEGYMKKKIFALVLVVALVASVAVGLAACNDVEPGYTPVNAQADILTELNAGTADVGIFDFTMASYLLSQNTSLTKDLQIVDSIEFESEEYGIAFRKGSTGLADRVNRALNALKDTAVAEIAASYGLTDNVLSLDYTAPSEVNDDDWNYIVGKGTVIIGYTLNPPMAIENEGVLSGFDIDLPKAVFEWINQEYGTEITVQFQLIDWDSKELELNGKTIDIIWNGMTITPEREASMTISMPYLLNRQVAVIRSGDADKYRSYDDLRNARIVAESGSAGETIAQGVFA